MLVVCTFPLILSLYGNINMASGYAGILAFTLLGASYLAIGLFISSLTESQVVAAVVTYITFILTLLMDSIANIVPKDNKTAVIVFAAIIVILCVVLYQMIKNYAITVGIGIIGEAVLIALYLLKPTIFDGSLVKVLNWFSVIGRYDSFYYGAFNVAAIVYYVSVIVLFIFLTTQVIKKKRWS
jgi:ABC-2 type transport system permease protein